MKEAHLLRRYILPILLMLCFIQGCAYGIYDDERLLDTMSSDKKLASKIKADLIKKEFSESFSIAVYAYYKHVFLVGEIPEDMQNKAVTIAHARNPLSVTTHWFTTEPSSQSNFIVSGRLRAALIGAKGLSSTRIDTEINSGRVVLLGVVSSEEERALAIRTARNVKGVQKVISLLMLSPKNGNDETVPHEEEYDGLDPYGESSQKTSSPPQKKTEFEEDEF